MSEENNIYSNTKPLFTVIIPAKNRAEYLLHTIRTCMIQEYENFEIIISDDCSTDNTKEVVEDAMKNDSRIRYYNHENGIGMRENFEFALNKVRPGFVIALGADDGLLPNGIKNMHKVLQQTGLELLTWPAALYSFPGVYDPNGQLIVYHKKGVKIIDSTTFLNRQVKNLWYLNDIECPMFYVKGVVSTDLINKVKSRSSDGYFYSCPTPDGFSGIVLSGEVEKYAFSGEPFSIYGMSSSSQGLAYLSNEEKAKKDSESFFRDAALKPMHDELASQQYSPLITLMTADYLLTCKDLPGWPGRFENIDFKKVIDNSFRELSLGVYGDHRIIRELCILKEISKKHGLSEYFDKKLVSSRRFKKRNYFKGNGISFNAVFFDGKALEINNILDASYAASNIYSIYKLSNYKLIFTALLRSVKFYFQSVSKGEFFPKESEWNLKKNN